MTSAQSGLCYGLLQSSPANYLLSPNLTFSANNTLYLYTSLLQRSTCSRGNLTAFNFCYRPSCINQGVDSKPAFYALLLFDDGVRYTVTYVYEERVDKRQLCNSITSCCCKQIPVESSEPVVVNSSYALAIIIPDDASGDYLYEIESTSQGAISNTPPPVPLPNVGEVLVLERESPRPIPSQLFRVVIEPLVI